MPKDILMYKDRRVVRHGDKIIYGNLNESHIAEIDIISKKKVGDTEIADKVDITLLLNDMMLSRRKRTVKTAKKNGLFSAFDLASVWLTRYCK